MVFENLQGQRREILQLGGQDRLQREFESILIRQWGWWAWRDQ